MRKNVIIAAMLISTLACSVQAIEECANSINTAGGIIGNTRFVSYNSVGQSCPVGFIPSESKMAASGFYASFGMFTNLDNNANGICDEFDPDDDGDGISDAMELSGTLFSPICRTDMMKSDTDGDGITDYLEFMHGMSPLEPYVFKVEGITIQDNQVVLRWKSHYNSEYKILCGDNLGTLESDPVMTHTFATPANEDMAALMNVEYTIPCTPSSSCGFFKVKAVKINGVQL